MDADESSYLARHFLAVLPRLSQDYGHVRVIREGKDLSPAEFYDARIGDNLIVHSQLRDDVVSQVLRDGGTIVIDHVNDVSPIAQVIQEFIEVKVGGDCWIQCYITQGVESPFDLHGDDHPFLICQLFGRKDWIQHDPEKRLSDRLESRPGNVRFYPRGLLHKVTGKGELSIHLTVAFDRSIEGKNTGNGWYRHGTGLPYSSGYPVGPQTAARLALRKRSWNRYRGKLRVQVGDGKLIWLNSDYEKVLEQLISSPASTPAEISAKFGIALEETIKFWSLGFQHGLLFRSLTTTGEEI